MESNELYHYGIKYRSGRYPYGSGEDPYQHDGRRLREIGSREFRDTIANFKKQGLTDKEISEELHMPIKQWKLKQSVEKIEDRNESRMKVLDLQKQGCNNSQISRILGIPEATVRNLLKDALNYNNNIAVNTANMLKEEVDKYGMTDVGKGMSNRLRIKQNKLDTALMILENQGYSVKNIPVTQAGTGKKTLVRCLMPPGMTWTEGLHSMHDIHIIDDPYSEDGGRTWEHMEPPRSISSKRVFVRYSEDGGKDKDGLIEIRPNVEDLDMGRNQYAQVRIAVDGNKFMKGMAIYSDKIPEGYDIVYNSNKSREHADEVFKPFKDDPNNPFGSAIKENEYDDDGNLIRETGQRHYIDKNGNKQLSAINIINEQGDWGNWKRTISSQMLSKQKPELARRQLDLAYSSKEREFNDIQALTNPMIKKKLLESFWDDCEASAVHLKAAALPGQRSNVLIPFPEMKDDEIYAPNYPDGSLVSLIRHPHEGQFAIPTLRVNNSHNPEAKKILENAKDAVGINANVAKILSGADFDGDSVLVIPNPGGKFIETKNPLPGLRDFDPTDNYGRDAFPPEQRTWINPKKDPGFRKQQQMGQVSNLITDMTLKGANEKELEMATKHSMVVIDAEKHDLNWRQSEIDNHIRELKARYQGGPNKGASTLISKSKGRDYIFERKQFYKNMIDPETGEIDWKYTNRLRKEKNKETGKWEETNKLVKTETTKMGKILSEGRSAHELSSGLEMEEIYADYADDLHILANKARLLYLRTPDIKKDKAASLVYKKEVESIQEKIDNAKKNAPLERKANAIASEKIKLWKLDNPDAEKDDIKKHKGLFLKEARQRMGSAKHRIKLTPKEWEAIQAGAISANMFREVLNNTDLDVIKDYATPKNYQTKLSPAEISYAKSLLDNGNYSRAQVAEALGVSVSTLYNLIE